MNPAAFVANLGAKALRRLAGLHKPLVRQSRRRSRDAQQVARARAVIDIEREIARLAASGRPIVAGPWLAEVGYEVLYWVPFLRWVRDRHRLPADRLVVLTRGGLEHLYAGIAGRYIDLFDVMTPAQLAAGNAARQESEEGGGRKQSSAGAFDRELLARVGVSPDAALLHPSLMFRLFREVWHGNLPLDVLWAHTAYELLLRPARPHTASLPARYVAVKLYTGPALRDEASTRARLRELVAAAARTTPVVVLDTGLAVDDHADYPFAGMPNVVSARELMTPRTNLGVQLAVLAHSDYFLSTCGGLAWMAPLMGVPTVAVYGDDRFLAPHLLVARLLGRRLETAEFSTLDLRAHGRFVDRDRSGRITPSPP